MAANPDERGIVERRAFQAPVVEQKAERLDQIDRDAETGSQAQQRPGILRDVGLEQGEAQIDTSSVRVDIVGGIIRVSIHAFSAADLCGSLSHSSASSTV